MKQIMITAMQSGSGKTVVTCALLRAMQNRGIQVQAFKCGPDYIDPMFHSKVLGVPSRNLDLFLQGESGVKQSLAHAITEKTQLIVIESAMGFYDGVASTDEASGYALAKCLQSASILVVKPKGASLTLAAQIKGLINFRQPNFICGVLFNECHPSLFTYLKPIIERETGLPVLGYLKPMEQAQMSHRHLGLMTADEITDFSNRFTEIAEELFKTVDLDLLLELASEHTVKPYVPKDTQFQCRIAVAKDEAFCFYYQDNLALLEKAGATLVYFSPLHDKTLPNNMDGLYLGGGYPELYAKALHENTTMRKSIKGAIKTGLPTVAECGGFLYLQQSLEGADGQSYDMVGLQDGQGYRTNRLNRFGYLSIKASENSMLFQVGETIPAHEFHYWECTQNGGDLQAVKPHTNRNWSFGFVSHCSYFGFPHLHFGGALPLAERFVAAAKHHQGERNGSIK